MDEGKIKHAVIIEADRGYADMPALMSDYHLQTTLIITQFGLEVYKIFEVKICLNLNSKTDRENRSCDGTAFLSEIIEDYRFWQAVPAF